MKDRMREHVADALAELYGIEAEIGRGGMSLVYRATDLRLRRRVAVKVLPPELAFRDDVRTRFLREAETAAQLSHPNIVPIYSVDERAGVVFFVMALVEGESLAARLVRESRPPVDTVRRILAEVADALAYAHSRRVIHRDVKPDNILLDAESGRAVVTDFGIARAAEMDSHLTATGITVGTPAYMSPEQAVGERELDGRSDIYSLGVVGYQMLAGELPFTAANTPSMLMKHMSERPRPLLERRPDLPPGLAGAIERALAKRREHRWDDATAFRDALWSERPVAAARTPEPRPAPEERPPAPAPPPPAPPYPLSRGEWREYWRAQRRGGRDGGVQPWRSRPVEERIAMFRRSVAGYGGVITLLAGINLLTSPWFPWFLFPAMGMAFPLLGQAGSLWADGVTVRQLLRRPTPALGGAHSAGSALLATDDEARALVPRDVLDGPHGGAVKRGAADRAAIRAIVDSLAKADRALIPEVMPTADALLQRVASLAQMLQHLEGDVSPAMLARIESRVAAVRREPESSADRERRLGLLERQRATLRELAERRDRVAAQLDSAGIALQNLKLDLLKLRSSGVQAALGDVTSATQEARALSREIGHVLDAAAEIRGL